MAGGRRGVSSTFLASQLRPGRQGMATATLSACQLAGDPRKEPREKKDLTDGAFLCLVMVGPSQCTPGLSF